MHILVSALLCNKITYKFNVKNVLPFQLSNRTRATIFIYVYIFQKLAYTRSFFSLSVRWDGFPDDESGIKTFNLTLWERQRCRASLATFINIENVQLPGHYTKYTFVDLDMNVSAIYPS